MSKTFADTFYYLALLNPGDEAHALALEATANRSGTLVTSQWVLTEVGDAMAAPATRRRYTDLIDAIESDPDTIVVPADAATFQHGIALFRQRADKSWPLTDCISFLVMDQHQIREVLTGDRHFAQAGFTPLLAKTIP